MLQQPDATLYEGKAKILYATSDPKIVIQEFKDDLTAFNAQKKGTFFGKGALNCQISSVIFQFLAQAGVPVHFRSLDSPRRMVIDRLDMVPIEVVVRNRVAGSLAKRLGIPEGEILSFPVIEWYYKRDDLGDPMVNRDHIRILKLASDAVLDEIRILALKVNGLLLPFFRERSLVLVDMKLEFGWNSAGSLVLGDEVDGDTSRLWDLDTGEKLDKDRFRMDLGSVKEGYEKIYERVVGHARES
ncbi:MAG: phosphoribosylaminoimidazolesuccinocarboxamide synthase [Nitrospirota bacterium]|nr:phosphoribosylaminoimidazolesuccinocarboxamide synthase [Nitrospirota bacterium]